MHNLTHQIVCLAMTGALAIAGLGGCAGQAGQAVQAKELSSAAELAEMSEKSAGSTNYHFEGSIDIGINAMGQEIPMKMTVVGDTADGNTHLTTTMDALLQKQENETYFVKENGSYIQYSSSKVGDGEQQWSKASADSNPIESLSNKDLLSAGEFSKTDNGYTITLSGEQVMNAIANVDQNLENALKSAETADLQKALSNSKIVFAFDKNADITSETLNFGYDAKSEVMGQAVEMNIKVAADIRLSNHGSVDTSKVTVPDTIKKGAVDTAGSVDDLLKQIDSLGGSQSTTGTSAQPAA